MIYLKKDAKIFVYCPGDITTGGPEALHQLVDALNNKCFDAYIVYYPRFLKDDFYKNNHFEIPLDYRKYNIKVAKQIEEHPDNIVVINESILFRYLFIKKCQYAFWWLSTFFHHRASAGFISPREYITYNTAYIPELLLRHAYIFLVNRKQQFVFWKKTLKEVSKLDVPCFYQGEFVQHYINNRGFKRNLALKDYIHKDIRDNKDKSKNINKENIILYNPHRDTRKIEGLKKMIKDVKWVALKGLSREQMARHLLEAKIYIDFGEFPGRDRIPREAAISGCCLIMGKRGAAAYFGDTPIPSKYQFDDNGSLEDVVKMIRYVLNNYDDAIKDFTFYRESVLLEEENFNKQVDDIFKRTS